MKGLWRWVRVSLVSAPLLLTVAVRRYSVPDVARIAAGYSFEQFARLMRSGKAPGDHDLPLIRVVARKRFSHFTDHELRDLHSYLSSAAAGPDTTGQ